MKLYSIIHRRCFGINKRSAIFIFIIKSKGRGDENLNQSPVLWGYFIQYPVFLNLNMNIQICFYFISLIY